MHGSRCIMISEITTTNVPIKLWSKLDEVESAALDQLKNVALLPQVFHCGGFQHVDHIL